MNHFARYGVSIGTTAALLAGCGGSQPPIGAEGTMSQSHAIATHADRNKSWMTTGAKAVKRLLYVSNEFYGNVYVYDFDTGAQVGELTGLSGPRGQCVDKAGDVWITDSNYSAYYDGQVIEYKHGGTEPIQTLSTYGEPVGCAVDPATGNIAVSNGMGQESYSGPNITILNASGYQATYTNAECDLYMGTPGYDARGNLYVEGATFDYGDRVICELPAGGDKLIARSTDVPGVGQGGVMWDGRYLTLEAQSPSNPSLSIIYRVVRRGRNGELFEVGRTLLRDSTCGGTKINQPFIVGKRNTPDNHEEGYEVVGSNTACGYRLDYWRYDAGGRPQRHLSNAPRNPYGESVSIREEEWP